VLLLGPLLLGGTALGVVRVCGRLRGQTPLYLVDQERTDTALAKPLRVEVVDRDGPCDSTGAVLVKV